MSINDRHSEPSGRYLIIVTLIAYALLVAFYMTPVFIRFPIFSGAGLGDIMTFFMLGGTVGILAFVAAIAMLKANGRYLAERKPVGRVRIAVLASVPLYILILLGVPVVLSLVHSFRLY